MPVPMEPSSSAVAVLEKVLPALEIKSLLRRSALVFVIAVPISGVVYTRVLLAGQPTSFSPSEQRLGFQEGPASRGTLNLIWACFSTIFTCVYVSLHLDIPTKPIVQDAQDAVTYNVSWRWRKKARYWQEKIWRWLEEAWHWLEKQTFVRKVAWMGVNIVLPEVLTGIAAWEYRSAKAGVKYMEWKKHERQKNCEEWENREEWEKYEGWKKYEGWTLTHAFFADMGGFKVPVDGGPNGRVLHSGVEFYEWFEAVDGSIDFHQLLLEINDRNDADALLKAYTCIQALWFVAQAIVRAIEHRAVSELEVTTCAYVMSTVAAYGFWWYKPKDVQQPILLHIYPPAQSYTPRDPSPFERPWKRMVSGLDAVMHAFRSDVVNPLWNSMKSGFNAVACVCRSSAAKPTVIISPPKPVPRQVVSGSHSWPFNRYCGSADVKYAAVIVGVVGAGIGAIHCGLWNAQFINSNGQLLWRICCGVQIVAVLIEALQPLLPGVSRPFHIITFIIMGSSFCFARIVTVLLIILSFRSLPAGVYKDIDWTWSAFPHWH